SVTPPVPALTVVAPVAVMAPAVWVMLALVLDSARVPEAVMLLPSARPPAPVTLTLAPDRLPGVLSSPPLDSVRSAVPVLIAPAGVVSAPPATRLTAWFVPL